MLEQRPGFVALRLTGRGATALLRTEPGGHRWQRVPPGEKRGRVHTSTITVAVLQELDDEEVQLILADVDFDTYGGSGPGGQNRNKVMNCVRAVHRPTGLAAKSESERSLRQNKALALAVLAARVREAARRRVESERSSARRQQVGSGQRGDKIRTIRTQDGVVTCERTHRKGRLKDYLRGDLEWLE